MIHLVLMINLYLYISGIAINRITRIQAMPILAITSVERDSENEIN